MTYVIIVWNDHKQRKVLKGFDKAKPVFVSEAKWKSGCPVQEYANTTSINVAFDKINKYERWRHKAVVEVH